MIVWDNELIAPVGMVADVQFLREHGVSKMVRLPAIDLTKASAEDEFLFLIRPQLSLVNDVIQAIRCVCVCMCVCVCGCVCVCRGRGGTTRVPQLVLGPKVRYRTYSI